MCKSDIENKEDIKKIVNSFYDKVKNDDLIGPVFNGVIQDKWPHHLEKMYRFWETVLLEEYSYTGRPFPPHAHLPVDETHFERWKALFSETVYGLFEGPVADEAVWRAGKMAAMFLAKITYFRDNGLNPVI